MGVKHHSAALRCWDALCCSVACCVSPSHPGICPAALQAGQLVQLGTAWVAQMLLCLFEMMAAGGARRGASTSKQLLQQLKALPIIPISMPVQPADAGTCQQTQPAPPRLAADPAASGGAAGGDEQQVPEDAAEAGAAPAAAAGKAQGQAESASAAAGGSAVRYAALSELLEAGPVVLPLEMANQLASMAKGSAYGAPGGHGAGGAGR